MISVLVGLCLGLLLVEGIFRVLEHRRERSFSWRGPGGHAVPDARWGWKPSPGTYSVSTSEWVMAGEIDSSYMNNPKMARQAKSDTVRLLVLGDSHTYAYGVSSSDSWPAVIDKELNAASSAKTTIVYNAAAVGYSMHQYLLRLMDQGDVVRPEHVLVGISYATDLYDLLPPSRGGWVYGVGAARAYFDFDSAGTLVEKTWTPDFESSTNNGLATTNAARARRLLWYSATFRYLRRSKLALWVGSRVRIGGESLWPNMEVVVEREQSAEHEYQWKLFEALLAKIHDETERRGAKLVVVGIPYMAQVYDDLWNTTFGNESRFSRTAAGDRVKKFCETRGIEYVDTLAPMRAYSDSTGRSLHYRVDGHPTAEGQRLIARTVLASGALAQ